MRIQLKEQGEIYWRLWISFIEKRAKDAQQRIDETEHLAQRMKQLLDAAAADHATAISEITPHIKSEDNYRGLIPVEMEEFVTNDRVNLPKLKATMGKVEASWQKRLADEIKREEGGNWRNELGKRISWPMAELDQNLHNLTTDFEIKTERDMLREEVKDLRDLVKE